MKKLARYIPEILVGSGVVCGLTTVVCFLLGIWTDDWQEIGKGTANDYWQYQGNDRWFHTAWLFLILTIAAVVGRVAWEAHNNDHGH